MKLSYEHRKVLGAYRYCTGATGGVPGVHRGGHLFRRALWAVWRREPAQVGWGATPPRAHAPKVGETLKGAPPCLGGKPPTPWPPPPLGFSPRGPAPLAPSPIYRGVRGGLQYTRTQCAAPPLPNTSPPPYVLGEALSEYCRVNCTTPSCCPWSCLPQPLLPPCWIKTEETSSVPYVC